MSKQQGNNKKLNDLRKKAQTGDALAQHELANVLATGSMGELNPMDSFYWNMKASLRGHGDAMLNAGLQLLEGVGVERSIKAGLYLIHLAANGNCYRALRYLGAIYCMGLHGVEMDKRQGEYWYRLAEDAETIQTHH
jgi:TPR repeat protein